MTQPIRRLEFRFDARTGARIAADGTSPDAPETPCFYYRDRFELTARMLAWDVATEQWKPHPLPGSMHYLALASFGADPAKPLLLQSNEAANVNSAAGEVTFLIDTFTQRFAEVVNGDDHYLRISGQMLAEFVILAIDPENATEQVLGKFKFEPVTRPDDASPAPSGGENTITVATGSIHNFFWTR